MKKDERAVYAIQDHVRSILLRLKVEMERPPAPPGPRDTSVEVERKDDKTRRVDDL
jgi:hypothetical protein